MEQQGLGREIEIYNEPADRETEPLLPPTRTTSSAVRKVPGSGLFCM